MKRHAEGASTPTAKTARDRSAAAAGPSSFSDGRSATDWSEYAFLLGHGVEAQTLQKACDLARLWGVAPHEVLILNSWIGESVYYKALAGYCRVALLPAGEARCLIPADRNSGPRRCLQAGLLRQARGPRTEHTLVPGGERPAATRNRIARMRRLGDVTLATPSDLRAAVVRHFAKQLMQEAIRGLARRYPGESAEFAGTGSQRVVIVGVLFLVLLSGVSYPGHTLRVLTEAATVIFAMVIFLRVTACISLVQQFPGRLKRRDASRLADSELPLYTILVPLFREARVLPNLIAALSQLDYPAAKLDIKLIFEACDRETQAAARSLQLRSNVDLIVIPDALPQTKPKALNYALQFARGDFAVIYDAEDVPHPGQLRAALAAFRNGPPNLACVQARLNFYNAQENWLTRQFALEYAALFDGFLPALQRLQMPIPLGGTSNHFRVSALRWLGAWDAFNVTEDADLGMRLYRHGYTSRMIDSTTLEEATCGVDAWVRQRTRWLKGYMQTWLVHMRSPTRLFRDLGPAKFLGFNLVIGGMVLSALLYPLFYVLAGVEAAAGNLFGLPGSVFGIHLWLIALFNVALGCLANMALAFLAQSRRGLRLGSYVIFIPAYWILSSVAAYRAVVQLVRAPFLWEKTEHGVCRTRPPSVR